MAPHLRAAGVDATVIVQSADEDADTDLMVETAEAHPQICAMVAYAPLDDAHRLSRRVDDLRPSGLLVGIRNLIHRRADAEWLGSAAVDRGLSVLEEEGLTLDVVGVLPRHLELVPVVAERHPGLRIVIDHLNAPPQDPTAFRQWRRLLAKAAGHPLVHAKVSGLYAPRGDGADDPLEPAVRHAIGAFGCARLMYGGDWPISMLHGGYETTWRRLRGLLDHLPEAELAEVLGGTAERFYRIDPHRLARARHARTAADDDRSKTRKDER